MRCLFRDTGLSLLTKAQILTLLAFGLIRLLITSRSMHNTTQKPPPLRLLPNKCII